MAQRLAQHLLNKGIIGSTEVDEALIRMASRGGSIDTALLESGKVTEAQVLRALAEVSGLRYVNLADFEPNLAAESLLSEKISRQLGIVPLSTVGKYLHIASIFPIPASELRDLGYHLGRRLTLWVAVEFRIREWQSAIYRTPLEPRFVSLLDRLDPSMQLEAVPPETTTLYGMHQQGGFIGEADGPGKPSSFRVTGENTKHRAPPVLMGGSPEVASSVSADSIAEEALNATSKITHQGGDEDPRFTPPMLGTSPPVLAPMPKKSAPAPQLPRNSPPIPVGTEGPPPISKTSPPIQAKPSPPRLATTSPPIRATQEQSPPTPGLSAPIPVSLEEPEPPLLESAVSERPLEDPQPPLAPAPPNSPPIPISFGDSPFPDAAPGTSPPISLSLGEAPSPKPAPLIIHSPPLPITFGDSPGAPIPKLGVPSAPEPRERTAIFGSPDDVPQHGATNIGDFQDSSVTPPLMLRSHLSIPPPNSSESSGEFDFSDVAQAILDMQNVQSGEEQSEVPAWTLDEARAELQRTMSDRRALVSTILAFGHRTFDAVAAFAVVRGTAVGWDARGELSPDVLRTAAIPLDVPSAFRTVAVTRGSYVGPVPDDQWTSQYLAGMGRQPKHIFLWPVEIKNRLVAFIYGDCRDREPVQRDLADFVLFCLELPQVLGAFLINRKKPDLLQDSTDSAPIPATAPIPALAAKTGFRSSKTDSSSSTNSSSIRRSDAQRWFEGLIGLLVAPDPVQRAIARVQLLKTPVASAQALCTAFPGPTGWARLPVSEVPTPDELGPIPGVLARLGEAGCRPLTRLLTHEDSTIRYFALLTAANMPFPEVVPGVYRSLFDPEPDVSSAARAAATALKKLPALKNCLSALRGELKGEDRTASGLAARALGAIHDRESVDQLIAMLSDGDPLVVQAAVDALQELSRASFGWDRNAWENWWEKARHQRRIEWLVESLATEAYEARLAAIAELSKVFSDNMGYFADASLDERIGAAQRWKDAVAARPDIEV